MTLQKLLAQLIALDDKGYYDAEVKLIFCDGNHANGDVTEIKGIFTIDNHPDKSVNGVYIDGTV